MTALRLIQKHGRLENVLAELESKGKYDIPQPFPFDEARRLFKGEACPFDWSTRTRAGCCAALNMIPAFAGMGCVPNRRSDWVPSNLPDQSMRSKGRGALCRAGGAARGRAAAAEVDARG